MNRIELQKAIEDQDYTTIARWLQNGESSLVLFEKLMVELNKKVDRLELAQLIIEKLKNVSDAEFLLEFYRIEKEYDDSDETIFWSL